MLFLAPIKFLLPLVCPLDGGLLYVFESWALLPIIQDRRERRHLCFIFLGPMGSGMQTRRPPCRHIQWDRKLVTEIEDKANLCTLVYWDQQRAYFSCLPALLNFTMCTILTVLLRCHDLKSNIETTNI